MSLIFSCDLSSKMFSIFKKKTSASKSTELVLYTGADNTSPKVKDKKAGDTSNEVEECVDSLKGWKVSANFDFKVSNVSHNLKIKTWCNLVS